MNEFWVVLTAVLPVFAIAGIGGALRRLNWLTEEADQSLLRVTVNVLVPCFIFDHVVGNATLSNLSNLLVAPLVGFGTVGLGILLGMAAVRFAGVTGRSSQNTFAFSLGVYNYGYVPLPLALALFGRETAGVLVVHNVGVEIAFWTLGFLMLGSRAGGSLWQKIFSPPLFAIMLSLVINQLGGPAHLPAWLLATVKMLGDCSIPLGLVLIGAIIADFAGEFHTAAGGRTMAVACGLRLGVLPVLFLLLARFLPCSVELKRVILLQAAMPAAVFTIIMAKHYGGDTPTALRVVISTSAVSLATIPLWIRWGMKFVGL